MVDFRLNSEKVKNFQISKINFRPLTKILAAHAITEPNFFRNSKILHFFGMKSEIDHSDNGYFG